MNQLQNKSFEEALVRYREKWDKIKDPCVVMIFRSPMFPVRNCSSKELANIPTRPMLSAAAQR